MENQYNDILEVWSVITWKDFTNYEVSNLGRIRHMVTKRIKSQFLGSGYLCVTLCRWEGRKVRHRYRVHRLVALAFCDNPNGYDTVDHEDEVKINNCWLNLRWMDNSENSSRSNLNRAKTYRRTRRMSEEEAVSLRLEFESLNITITDFAEERNINRSVIQRLLNRKTFKNI